MSADIFIISTKPYKTKYFAEKFPKDQWVVSDLPDDRYYVEKLNSKTDYVWIEKLDAKTTYEITSGIFDEDDLHHIDAIRGIPDPHVYAFTGQTRGIISQAILLCADNEDFYVDDDTERPIVSGAEYVRLIKSGIWSYPCPYKRSLCY